MRKLIFDSYEFDEPASEQTLEVAISSVSQHASLASFLAECGATLREGLPLPADWDGWLAISEDLHRFAGLDVELPADCQVILLNDECDDCEVALQRGTLLVWYHWWTTA